MSDDFFATMAQIGGTAYALMFAAIQFRWADWSKTRHGKIAAATALLELLTITLVAVAVLVGWRPLWPLVALACSWFGIGGALRQHRELVALRQGGQFPSRSETFQDNASFLPFLSYGTLALCATAELIPVSCGAPWIRTTVAVVLLWLLFSGLSEVLVTLNPNLLHLEDTYRVKSIVLEGTSTHAQLVEKAAGAAPNGSIVLLPEVWGVTSDTLETAERLADLGYRVLTPDYHAGDTRLRVFSEVSRDIASVGAASTSMVEAVKIAASARKWLAAHGSNSTVDVLGMSMGASAALAMPESWGRLVALYPPPGLVPDEPLDASNTLILAAVHDYGWRAKPARIEAALRSVFLGADVRIFRTRHGFFGGRGAPPIARVVAAARYRSGYSRKHAQVAWSMIEEFLDRRPHVTMADVPK